MTMYRQVPLWEVKALASVGPGGDTTDNVGELTDIVRTERHGKGDISSRMTFQGAKVRKLLLAVSGVIDKATSWSSTEVDPSHCQNPYAGVESVRKAITGVQGRIPLHAKNGAFVLRT